MNYEFCLNPLSLPCDTKEHGYEYLCNIFTGIANLVGFDSVPVIYANDERDNTFIAEGWTITDFLLDLQQDEKRRELAEFALEYDDKSPLLQYMIDDAALLKMISESKFFFLYENDNNSEYKEQLGDDTTFDIIKYACLQNFILLSLPSERKFRRKIIPIILINPHEEINEIPLSNIFNEEIEHIKPITNCKDIFNDKVIFSPVFYKWYENLHTKDQSLVRNTLNRAFQVNFHGNGDRCSAIKGSQLGLREWKGGHPIGSSGWFRIYYKVIDDITYIPHAGIKIKPDFYTLQNPIAENAMSDMLKNKEIHSRR
jgi:hypothetical protein